MQKRPHQSFLRDDSGITLREQVTNPNGEFHFNGNETLIPNNDDHLYRF